MARVGEGGKVSPSPIPMISFPCYGLTFSHVEVHKHFSGQRYAVTFSNDSLHLFARIITRHASLYPVHQGCVCVCVCVRVCVWGCVRECVCVFKDKRFPAMVAMDIITKLIWLC